MKYLKKITDTQYKILSVADDSQEKRRMAEMKKFVKNGKLTVDFIECEDGLSLSYMYLISLKGCPNKILGSFSLSGNFNIESYDGGPLEIEGRLYLKYTNICRLPENLKCHCIVTSKGKFDSVSDFNKAYELEYLEKQTLKLLSLS